MASPVARYNSVLDALGGRIAHNELSPGDVVVIDDLSAQLKASRTVVREAIKVLESMGLVTSKRRVGIVIAPRESWNVFDPRLVRWRLDGDDRARQLRELSELRLGVEPAAAALAAERATPDQCAELTRAVMEMSRHGRSGDLDAYLEADILFHQTLLAASANTMIAALHTAVAEILAGRTRHGLMPATPNPDAIRAHSEVAQAVQAGDSEGAQAAMSALLDEATQAILDATA